MSRYIDADALKETIVSNVYPVVDDFNNCDYGMFWTGGIEKAIDEQPTIEECKTGKWEWISKVAHNIGHRCSICQKHAERIISKTELVDNYYCNKAEPMTVYTHVEMLSDYCPYCGARMQSPDEEEEGVDDAAN